MNRDIFSDALGRILQAVRLLDNTEKPVLIAIDGRCGAGKSTLAEMLKGELGCCVVHMDDFFLQPKQRTPERYGEPGGNVDYERFLAEVMEPLLEHREFSYRPYDCKCQTFSEAVQIQPCDFVIIEGAYSCRPDLWDFYSFRVFLSVGKEEQLRRIAQRNGKEAAEIFRQKWIPLEERYFEAYDIEERCDLRIQM